MLLLNRCWRTLWAWGWWGGRRMGKQKQDKRRKKKKVKNKNKKWRNRKKQDKASKGCYGFEVVRCVCGVCVAWFRCKKTHTHPHTHIHKKGWESIYRRGNSSAYLTNHANRGAIIDNEGGRGRRRRRRRRMARGGEGGGRFIISTTVSLSLSSQ